MCASHGGKLLTINNRATFQFIRAHATVFGLQNIALGLNFSTNLPDK